LLAGDGLFTDSSAGEKHRHAAGEFDNFSGRGSSLMLFFLCFFLILNNAVNVKHFWLSVSQYRCSSCSLSIITFAHHSQINFYLQAQFGCVLSVVSIICVGRGNDRNSLEP